MTMAVFDPCDKGRKSTCNAVCVSSRGEPSPLSSRGRKQWATSVKKFKKTLTVFFPTWITRLLRKKTERYLQSQRRGRRRSKQQCVLWTFTFTTYNPEKRHHQVTRTSNQTAAYHQPHNDRKKDGTLLLSVSVCASFSLSVSGVRFFSLHFLRLLPSRLFPCQSRS